MYNLNRVYDFNKTNLRALPNTTRAGVIPFTFSNGHLYFLFGQDKKSLELTDFGGTRKKKEYIIDTAWREFQEETCNIFKWELCKNDLKKAFQLQDNNMHLYFVPVNPNTLTGSLNKFQIALNHYKTFRNKKLRRIYTENSSVIWVNDKQLQQLVWENNNSPYCLWKNITRFLVLNTSYIQLYTCLLLYFGNYTLF